jgi:energy-coupling factor transporter ATP-binding protein EcfA2
MFSKSLSKSGFFSLSVLLSALHCNGFSEAVETGPEPERGCGRTIASTVAQPDKPTVMVVPAGHLLAGTQLHIPAGAVSRPTQVELTFAQALRLEPGQQPLSPSLCVIADGVTFQQPVSLIAPFDKAKYERLGLTPEQVGMGGVVLNSSSPSSLGIRRLDSLSETVAQVLPGMFVFDLQNSLLGVEITASGMFGVISRGTRSPAKQPLVDILSVVDNSPSMSPKQLMVARLLPKFFDMVSRKDAKLFNNCVDWHLGTITTDVSHDPLKPGDDGKLRSRFCDPTQLSGDAQKACQALGCDTLPALTAPYLQRDTAEKYEIQSRQYQCLMLVGDRGSGKERPLEALSRFIKDEQQKRMTMGAYPFFRDVGLSVVMFLTDEQDCSVDPARYADFDKPYNPACTTHSPECYHENFRCYAMSLECDGRADFHTLGRYEKCREPTTGLMKSTQVYADELFAFLTGMKAGGNLERGTDVGSFMLRAIVPMSKDSKEIPDPKNPLITDQWQVSFEHPAADAPSTRDISKAFCSRIDSTMKPIIGNVQNRINNFVERFYNKSRFTSPFTSDPLVELRSICDDENTLADALLGLAKELSNKDTVCEKPLPTPMP